MDKLVEKLLKEDDIFKPYSEEDMKKINPPLSDKAKLNVLNEFYDRCYIAKTIGDAIEHQIELTLRFLTESSILHRALDPKDKEEAREFLSDSTVNLIGAMIDAGTKEYDKLLEQLEKLRQKVKAT
jgi:hypothetical protein